MRSAARLLPTRRARWTALAAVVVVAAVAGLLYFRRGEALTQQDYILLTDFTNTTGDAVFDGTLKQALAVQLSESPFLNVVSDERVRDALRLMSRPPDERITGAVGREICQREGIKALLTGTIAQLGSQYVVTLEAVNAGTGDVLAREQAQAGSKEEVLTALGTASSRVRARLGESLASIAAYDTPIEEATTASLEALKAYSTGEVLRETKADADGHPLLREGRSPSTRTSPWRTRSWAPPSATLGESPALPRGPREGFRPPGPRQRARAALHRSALPRRGHRQPRERRRSSWRSGSAPTRVTSIVHYQLGILYGALGQYDRAVEEQREEIRLSPSSSCRAMGTSHMTYYRQGRLAEAREVLRSALDRGLDNVYLHTELCWIAVLEGDQRGDRARDGMAPGAQPGRCRCRRGDASHGPGPPAPSPAACDARMST